MQKELAKFLFSAFSRWSLLKFIWRSIRVLPLLWQPKVLGINADLFTWRETEFWGKSCEGKKIFNSLQTTSLIAYLWSMYSAYCNQKGWCRGNAINKAMATEFNILNDLKFLVRYRLDTELRISSCFSTRTSGFHRAAWEMLNTCCLNLCSWILADTHAASVLFGCDYFNSFLRND